MQGAWTIKTRNTNSPCYFCTEERTEACHVSCGKYISWGVKQKVREQRRKCGMRCRNREENDS